MTQLASSTQDQILRYTFDHADVRGELVQLEDAFQQLCQGHDYPAGVRQLLGELMAVTSLLSATLKFTGHINVQLQGDGALNFATVNGSNQQNLRGMARLTDAPAGDEFQHLIGNKSYLIITLSPDQGERYQGVVEVRPEDQGLADVIERYFAQSEQLATKVWLHASDNNAAGMLLQALPGASGSDTDKQAQAVAFEHLSALTDTITADELHGLAAETILHRLYHEEAVRVYPATPVIFYCGCSKEKSMQALKSVPLDELQQILAEDGEVTLTCEYCLTVYQYDAVDIGALESPPTPTQTQ